MTGSLTLRPGTSADAAPLLQLVRDCIAAMRAAGIEQWDEVYPNAEVIAKDIAGGTVEVLCDGPEIVACITIDSHLEAMWQGLDWTPEGEPAAAVHRLMVHPSQQGRGIARQLMRHAEAVARQRGCRSIRLDTFPQNPAAMALYTGLGYRSTGRAMMRKGEFIGFEKLILPDAPAASSP